MTIQEVIDLVRRELDKDPEMSKKEVTEYLNRSLEMFGTERWRKELAETLAKRLIAERLGVKE